VVIAEVRERARVGRRSARVRLGAVVAVVGRAVDDDELDGVVAGGLGGQLGAAQHVATGGGEAPAEGQADVDARCHAHDASA
jgi:hypothetical protein